MSVIARLGLKKNSVAEQQMTTHNSLTTPIKYYSAVLNSGVKFAISIEPLMVQNH
jgi:hypothetical protein